MSRAAKLWKHLRNSNKNVSFDDLCLVLSRSGFIRRRTSGSHRIFKHDAAGMISLQPDQNGKAKPYQVTQVVERIEKYKLEVK